MKPDLFGILVASLAAVGAFNILVSAAGSVVTVGERFFMFSRRWMWKRPVRTQTFDPYGLDAVPWDALRLASALAGAGLAALLFWERSPYLAVLGLAGGYVPSLVRAYLLRRRKERVDGEIRHLIRALGGSLRAYGGLSPVLQAVAALMDNPVGRRLAFHLGTGKSGQETLEALAADFRSERLTELARRLAEAGTGVRAPEQVLEETLEQMRRDSLARAREAIGAAPVRLLIPMLFFLLPPILILALNPPVARLMALLSGTRSSPVGW